MSYPSIVVFQDDGRNCAKRLDFTIDMAVAHRAHLTGLYLVYQPMLPPYAAEIGFAEPVVELEAATRAKRNLAEQTFRQAVERAGIAFDWQALPSRNAGFAAMRARTADLAIVGQRDPDDDQSFAAEGFPEQVVLDSGRPTLILPYAGTFPPTFKRVLVAWNGSREAARALADALPLLARASSVTIVAVESKAESRRTLEVPGVDVASYLSRHGVKAEVAPVVGVDIPVGEWLLSQLADWSADLLVAGAYGHSRVREFVLGGVTQTLLREMTVPVLMSH